MTHRYHSALMIAVASMALLTGCSSSSSTAESTSHPATSTDPSTEETSAPTSAAPEAGDSSKDSQEDESETLNKRGEKISLSDPSGNRIYQFSINSASATKACPNNEEFKTNGLMKNGHLIQLSITEEIGDLKAVEDPEFREYLKTGTGVNSSSFTYNIEDGVRANDIRTPVTYNCLGGTGELPENLKSKEKARGVVLLDLPDTNGTLTYTDPTSDSSVKWRVRDLLK